MPEIKSLEAELRSLGGQLESQLKTKYQEYQTKFTTYQKNATSMPEAIRIDKESELVRLQESIQKFQQDAEASYHKKQEELMAPIYLKIGKSINEVAAENNYSVIINSEIAAGQKVLLFFQNKSDIPPWC